MSYTADDLDGKMFEFFKKPTGFYVEAGAFDGRGQSNTLLFSERGWSGILIEPIPHIYERLIINRPKDICLPYCLVGDQNRQTAKFYCCDFMSLVAGSRGEHIDDMRWIRDGEYAQGIAHKEIMVPCRTLGSILDEYNSPHVDWLSLDIEGGELDALRGLGQHRPDTILVELSRLIPETTEYLYSIGYGLIHKLTDRDWLFKYTPRY